MCCAGGNTSVEYGIYTFCGYDFSRTVFGESDRIQNHIQWSRNRIRNRICWSYGDGELTVKLRSYGETVTVELR
jgi:hypothetical protein